MGWHVHVKIWIHFIAGDTSGCNNLVGHMNGGQPEFIYQDCRCLFDEISNAFENVPFSDEKNGLLGSVPAKMLHNSGPGLLKYMFGCL
jgi:hypothetical protein